MSDVDLIINVHTNGIKDITNLSAATKALANNIRGITIPMAKLDAQSKAVNKALGMTSRGMNDHAKSVKGLVANFKALSDESKRVKSNIASYRTAIQLAGGANTEFGRELKQNQAELIAFSKTLRGLRIRAFGSDLQSIALRMQKLGKDAQFVGRSLMINLTAPITLFARMGFQSLLKIDKQLVRLTKVLEGVAMTAEQADAKLGGGLAGPEKQARIQQMVNSFNQLNRALTGISNKFGVSKDLVAALASDFAELGISANENITALTEMTLAAEKLGGMDASGAQDLSQALYFNSNRALEASGAFDKLRTARERETRAINAARTQLYMFNAIENVTALTLKDLAASLPEVGSMAVSFGLSMTEAAALLAPMKAAGLDVGASANSIKVSLQRAISPTKQNAEMLGQLAIRYGVASDSQNVFNRTTKTGVQGLQAIVDMFATVKNSSAGAEGALKLMSEIFEKRQGPRMYIAIEQLALFDRELNKASRTADSSEGMLANVAEQALISFNRLNGTELPQSINNFSSIGMIARIATAQAGQMVEGFGKVNKKEIEGANQARKAVADFVLQKKQAEGIDIIGTAKTEAARAMLIELAGASNAQDVANMELEQSLNSLSVAVERIKNGFKLFAADLLAAIGPAVKNISDRITSLYEKWQNASEETRQRVQKFILGFLGLLAALGPVVLAFGTVQASVGVLGRGFAALIPKLQSANGGFIGVVKSARLARQAIDDVYTSLRSRLAGRAILPTFSPVAGTAGPLASMPKRFGTAIGSASPITGATVSRTPGRAGFGFAAATRESVNQYLRNEADILSRSDMRVTRSGRFTGPSGRFLPNQAQIASNIARASSIREGLMEQAGIATSASGIRTFKGRELSEGQAMRMARGGIGARVTRATSFARELPGMVSSAPSKAMDAYKNSIKGAKTALAEMRVQQMAVGGGSFIKTATTAMTGFMKATNLGTIALKIMKMTLITSGVGAVLIGVAVAAVMIAKNFDEFKKKGDNAFKVLKSAFGIFKNAIMEIARPFIDLFSSFDKGANGSKTAVGGLARAFGGIAKAIQFVAKLFASFVKNVIQPYLYGIINIVMAVVAIFTGDWEKAVGYLTAAFAYAGKILVSIFKLAFKALIQVAALGIKGILSFFTMIPKMAAKALGFLGRFIPGFSAIGDGINKVIDTAFGLVDAGKKIAMGAVDSVGDFINKGLDAGIKKGMHNSGKRITTSKNNITDPAEEVGYEAGEAIANATGEGFDENDPSEKIGKSIQDGIKDAVQQLQDYVAGELKNALDKFVDASVKALEKQKDSALKVFDVQLKTLTKLEKAEESLTKKKEYETNKRKLIDQKTLSDEQYRRNYALAVYEGRIDDARMLQLEQAAAEKNFGEELLSIEEARAKDLAKENLDALKEAINEAKDSASKFFEEAITKFQESAALITKIAPVTVEQYEQQLIQLQNLTQANSDTMNNTFGDMFEKFASTIEEKMPNKVVGVFTTNLDELVSVAKEKFGLGADAGENTVIGVTIGMLSDIGAKFGENKQSVIDSFGLITTGIKSNFSEMKSSFLDELKNDFLKNFKAAMDAANPTEVFNKAIIDGNESILRSFQNMVDLNPELMEKLRKSLDPAILGYIELKARADAAAEAAANAAEAGAGGGGGGGAGAGSAGATGTQLGRVDAFESANRLRVAAGQRALTYSEFTRGAGLTTAQIRSRIPTGRQFAKGGSVPSGNVGSFIPSGYISAPTQEGVPALLHGGEYIVNAKAVKRIGVGALNKLNNNLIPRFAKGGVVPGGKNKKGDGTLNGPYGTVVKPVVPGNINLKTLPVVKNNIPNEGGVSTVRSISIGVDKGTMLIPTVVNGKILSDQQAIKSAINSGKNLGIYKNDAAAEMAAQLIHLSEANRVGKRSASNTRGTADRAEQQINARIVDARKQQALAAARMAISQKPYDFNKDPNLNPVQKFIHKGIDITTGLGKKVYDLAVSQGESYQATFVNPLINTGGSIVGKNPRLREAGLVESILNTADVVATIFTAGTSKAVAPFGKTLAKEISDMTPKKTIAAKISGFVGKLFGRETNASVINKAINESTPRVENVINNMSKSVSSALEIYRGPIKPEDTIGRVIESGDRIITESFEKYKIGLEEVAFGIPETSLTELGIKNIPLNPYDISGLSPYTDAGQRVAKDWINAHMAFGKTGEDLAQNYIDALLYAGKRGDVPAMLKFNEYAAAGRKLIDEYKMAEFASVRDYRLQKVKRNYLDDLGIDDLFLVHETKFPPPIDEFGNISLKPAADYQTIFRDELGTTEYIRDTIHMTINHLVSGHAQRGNINNAHIIVSKLKDVIEANPGALDNLHTIDTWFTPKPGQGLVIPKGSFKSFTGGERPRHQVQEAMEQLYGKRLKLNMLFQGGAYGSETEGADELVGLIGEKLGAFWGPHFDTPTWRMGFGDVFADRNVRDAFMPNMLATLGDNALARLFQFSRKTGLSGIKKTTAWKPSVMKTGGYVPGSPSTPVPAILHGGEYVINADAVRNMGIRTMQSINQSRFRTPSGAPNISGYGQTTSVSTVNINVDTFIGEEEWFKSMMKSYNVNVLPKQQKAAGLESRTFTSYNGINQGL